MLYYKNIGSPSTPLFTAVAATTFPTTTVAAAAVAPASLASATQPAASIAATAIAAAAVAALRLRGGRNECPTQSGSEKKRSFCFTRR